MSKEVCNYKKSYPFNLAEDIPLLNDEDRRIDPEALIAAVNDLDPKMAMVLRLHYEEGKTLKEIAEELDSSVSKISELKKKAARKLCHPRFQENYTLEAIMAKQARCNQSAAEKENGALKRRIAKLEGMLMDISTICKEEAEGKGSYMLMRR